MKLKQIALLVAGLVGSASAFAGVTPAQIEAARVANTLDQAFITGASAPTKTIYEGFVGSGAAVGCDPGTQSIFTSQTGTNVTPGGLGNVLGYACTRAGRTLAVYHSIAGGSLTAYTPHTINATIERLRFLGSTCATGPLNYTDTTNANNNATVYKGCTALTAAAAVTEVVGNPGKPAGGFSDVEAALFPASIGGGDVTAFGTEDNAYVGQVFGVVVSKPLYRAMQVKQGIAANTDALDPNYDPANAPNITSQEYASIAVQGIGTSYQTDWSAIAGAAGTGKKVILARRVATSGTQASSNAFFLRNPCAGTALLAPAVAGDSSSTFEVFEGSGTGNVKTRLTRASDGFDANTGTVLNANNTFAIGVVSAENDWRIDAAASSGYRFVKVDGVHPEAGDVANARTTAANGAYNFHMELKTFVANTATPFAAALIPQIAANLNNPQTSACAVLPRGLTLNPTNPAFGASTSGYGNCALGAQVHKGSNSGNNCSATQLFF